MNASTAWILSSSDLERLPHRELVTATLAHAQAMRSQTMPMRSSTATTRVCTSPRRLKRASDCVEMFWHPGANLQSGPAITWPFRIDRHWQQRARSRWRKFRSVEPSRIIQRRLDGLVAS